MLWIGIGTEVDKDVCIGSWQFEADGLFDGLAVGDGGLKLIVDFGQIDLVLLVFAE